MKIFVPFGIVQLQKRLLLTAYSVCSYLDIFNPWLCWHSNYHCLKYPMYLNVVFLHCLHFFLYLFFLSILFLKNTNNSIVDKHLIFKVKIPNFRITYS